MNFYEKPANTAARGSNNAERSRWRNDGVDPELLADPFDVAAAVRAAQQQRDAEAVLTPVHRPVSFDVAQTVMVAAEVYVPDPATEAVNLSFERR